MQRPQLVDEEEWQARVDHFEDNGKKFIEALKEAVQLEHLRILGDKGVPAPPTRGDEERQPRDAIVEGDLRVAALGRQEARRGPVAAVLGPVGVVTCPDMGPECVSRR